MINSSWLRAWVLTAALGMSAAVMAQAGSAPGTSPTAPAPSAGAAAQAPAQPLNDAAAFRAARSGASHFTRIGAPAEDGVLILSSGQSWRQVRPPVLAIGGIMVAAAVLSLSAFFAWRGKIRVGETGSQQMVRRFEPADRYAHWFLAIIWVALAITGLILSFGKTLLVPIIGHSAFSWLAVLAKNLHNFVGPMLIIAVPWMIVRYLRHNWFGREDVIWLTKIFGNLTGHEYPSGKFNGGEKLVFWIVLVLLTTVLVVTGLILNFANFGQTRTVMQIANVLHMSAAFVAMAMAAVHIYLGTIGMSGAYRAMRDGYVTAEWAQHHHLRWYEDVKAGKVPESRLVAESEVPQPIREAVLLSDR